MDNLNEMSWTGERLVTHVTYLHGTIEHLHRYAIAADLCANKEVLDIASGEGYGTNLISYRAKKVTGVDISEESIQHAKKKYNKQNIEFLVGAASTIPLDDSSVDVVVSFETIEHHDQHYKMMLEIKRVLRTNGILIISSPEKSIYKDRDPNNPFHIKELTLQEFDNLVNEHFTYSKLYTQRYVTGSVITNNDPEDCGKFSFYDGNFYEINNHLKPDFFYNKPFFNFIICSEDIAIKNPNSLSTASFFNGYSVYEYEINELLKAQEASILHTRKLFMNSMRYKVGDFLLKPLYLLKSFFKKEE